MSRYRRKLRSALAALSLSSAVTFGLPAAPALASTFYQCTSPHCYDLGAENTTLSGLEGQWSDLSISMPSSEVENGYHASNEIWLNMFDGQWVEEGLARSCTMWVQLDQTCSGIGGSDAYLQFWADYSTHGVFFFHPIKTLTADGVSHSYEIWNSSNGANNYYDI